MGEDKSQYDELKRANDKLIERRAAAKDELMKKHG